jgi:hypothetical protein
VNKVGRLLSTGVLCFVLSAVLRAECAEGTRQEAFRGAAIVFRGRVERIEDLKVFNPIDKENGKLATEKRSGVDVVTFAVDRVWKGPVTSTVRLLTFDSPSVSGSFPFRLGRQYVVYALDDVDQMAPADVRRFSAKSHVYSVGMGCVMRVRTDTENESRSLGRGRSPQSSHDQVRAR